MTPLERRI